jgi:hypothetical protein
MPSCHYCISTYKEKGLLWLTVLEVLAHDWINLFILGLWWKGETHIIIEAYGAAQLVTSWLK